ncbi:MAG TPA: DUF4401 domain-containing protein [Saprospiraceae bacterium]|nr:DUF4401 domain-containing protein [Saprospiraceae bacterium]HPN68039.1 DUF4401 domain-containing protein [Saprospiraceae bacterium]
MDNEIKLSEILSQIALTEGSNFQYEESAMLAEKEHRASNQSSLSIKILSIIGGFLATLTFLGFLAITGIYDSKISMVILGILFIGGAIFINLKTDHLLLDTISISIFAAGLALLVFGLSEMGLGEVVLSLIVMLISVLTMYSTKSYMLSFLSFAAISIAFITILMTFDNFNLVHIYLALYTFLLCYWCLNESKIISLHPKLNTLYNPIRIGLIIALFSGLIFIGARGIIGIQFNFIWLSSIVNAAALIYVVREICIVLEVQSQKTKLYVYALSSLTIIITFYSPAISGSILVMLLCFLVNYKTGFGITIIGLLYFISQYYYDLNLSLLTKSLLLFFSGIVFIAFYLFTNYMLKGNEKI